MQVSQDYLAQLRIALRSEVVHRFVRTRLWKSLTTINIAPGCIADIDALLELLACRKDVTTGSFSAAIDTFSQTWRVHLDRAYFVDYEALRWPYVRDYVLNDIEPKMRLGRCLDVGCGRGWLTSQLVASGMADTAFGIDAADYASEWKERLAQFGGVGLEFAPVPTSKLSEWVQGRRKFDTMLMLYVLHHSSEYWVARTLSILRDLLSENSRLIILEDSCSTSLAAKHDRDQIAELWSSIAAGSTPYALTDAFHIQVVLDFVAVRLLASFDDVDMPCTYKTVEEWGHLFGQLGFRVEKIAYLGFPEMRDIDVPQSYFVLRAK